jgi:hypothetical protein
LRNIFISQNIILHLYTFFIRALGPKRYKYIKLKEKSRPQSTFRLGPKPTLLGPRGFIGAYP